MRVVDTIYAVCIPGKEIQYEAKSNIVPIMGGAALLTLEEQNILSRKGYVLDNDNANLSELNKYWGELSCVEWILLNANTSHIGNAQYRRGWIEPDSGWYGINTLYVPEAANFSITLEQQFYGGHRSFDGPAITRELADSGEWLFSRREIDEVWSQNKFFGCNMARGPTEHYKQFMGLLLSALFPLWKKHEEMFLSIEGYDKRAIAFLAERIMTGIILHRDKLLPGINIQTAPISFVK